jgi:drug/metabolite transporter (DMT)-like permease
VIFVVGLAAAVALGVGYVLQQRVAAHEQSAPPLSVRLLRQVLRRRLWWLGLLVMTAGQALSSWAMGLTSLAIVEPLLAFSLLAAFAVAAALARHAPRWQEVLGTFLLAGALGVFLGVSGPHGAPRFHWSEGRLVTASAVVLAVVILLVRVARRRGLAGEAVLIAVASGVLYGLQDVGTRGAVLAWEQDGLSATLSSPWPYLIAATGVSGLLLTQSAYRAGRLDYSLPPTTATEPVVGIALGVALLGDRLPTTLWSLLADAACAAALVGGVVLIGRSPALAPAGPEPVGVG